jgi:hypothetical protein
MAQVAHPGALPSCFLAWNEQVRYDSAKTMTDTKQLLGKKAITPLWIVALYVSLTELVLGVAVIQTHDWIQTALTIFVIAFPTLNAAAFFSILWFRPFVFYPPTEFGSQTSVSDYVSAMRGVGGESQVKMIEEAVRTTITSEAVRLQLQGVVSAEEPKVSEEILQILEKASKSAVEKVGELTFITVDTRPLLKHEGGLWKELYDPKLPISIFTDNLYFRMRPHIDPFTYEQQWVIRDRETSHVFRNLGYLYTSTNNTVADAGLRPGMVLEIVSPKDA